MEKFRSKVMEIEAEQFTQTNIPEPVKGAVNGIGLVSGKQGLVQCKTGDWIIKEMDGSGFYPCAPEVFEAKYERAST